MRNTGLPIKPTNSALPIKQTPKPEPGFRDDNPDVPMETLSFGNDFIKRPDPSKADKTGLKFDFEGPPLEKNGRVFGDANPPIACNNGGESFPVVTEQFDMDFGKRPGPAPVDKSKMRFNFGDPSKNYENNLTNVSRVKPKDPNKYIVQAPRSISVNLRARTPTKTEIVSIDRKFLASTLVEAFNRKNTDFNQEAPNSFLLSRTLSTNTRPQLGQERPIDAKYSYSKNFPANGNSGTGNANQQLGNGNPMNKSTPDMLESGKMNVNGVARNNAGPRVVGRGNGLVFKTST